MAINVPIVSSFDAKGINKAIREFRKLETGSQKAAFGLVNIDQAARRGIASFGKYAAIGAGVVGFLGSKLAAAAYESQKVMKQTEAIIKATGGAAGVTAEQIAELSNKISQQIGVDDELIQSSANLLLTFKQLRNQVGENNQVFDRALMAAQDLGNIFGSAEGAALQLGKALSDPIRGVTALRRAGINFTKQQQDQIKALVNSGKLLEAQKIVLAEVESQVGGTAAATATGFDRMKVALENVAEDLGTLLIPYIERFSNFINNTVVPVLQTFTSIVGEQGVGAGFNYLAGSLFNAINGMGLLGKVILGVTGAFVALRVATITYTAVQGMLTVAANITTNALRQQAIQANATKIALSAAGGLTALVTVAASAYAIYAGRKSEAIKRTKDFVDALKLEGEEQEKAIENLYLNDSTTRDHIDTMRTLGYTINDLTGYVKGGTSNLSYLVNEWNKADGAVKGIYPKLDAYAKALGISTDNGYEEIAMVRNMVQHFESLRAEQVKQVKMQIALARARGDGIKATQLMQQLHGLDPSIYGASTNALGENTDATDENAGSLGALGKSVKSAQEKFTEYVKSLKSYRDAKDEYVKAEKEVKKTSDNVLKATNARAVAQAKLNQIVKGFGAGSLQAVDAQKALEQAQRDAERAGYDLEKSQFAVTDAEKALEEARQQGTPQEIREAEIALAEAKIAVKEAELAQIDATTAVNDAQVALNETINGATESSKTYKDALKELEDANYELTEAIDAANEALKRQRDAQDNVNQSEREAISDSKGLTPKQKKRAERKAQINLPKKTKKGKAMGGSVYAGETYVVGERGRELFTPSSSGVITPNNKLGGDTYNIVINSKIADEALPDLIVAELRKFNRRSGAIKIQVA